MLETFHDNIHCAINNWGEHLSFMEPKLYKLAFMMEVPRQMNWIENMSRPTNACYTAESPTDTLQDIRGNAGTVEVAHHRGSDG